MNFTISWEYFGLFIEKFWPLNSFSYENGELGRDIYVIFQMTRELIEIVKNLKGGLWNYHFNFLGGWN